MKEIKQNLKDLLEKEGVMRGEVILNHINFIRDKEGDDGVQRLKSSFQELDYSLDLDIDPMDWEKVSIGSAITVLANDIFEWEKEDVKDMGRFAAKTLTTNKLMLREIPDLDALLNRVNDYWKAVIDVGELSVESSKKGEAKLTLKGFNYHPLDFIFISGYIEVIFDLFTKEKASIEYNLEGKNCNFLITWN
ncbi:MAG: hypothetical protein ACQEP3_01460 [Patescibacteria group bacterium]